VSVIAVAAGNPHLAQRSLELAGADLSLVIATDAGKRRRQSRINRSFSADYDMSFWLAL